MRAVCDYVFGTLESADAHKSKNTWKESPELWVETAIAMALFCIACVSACAACLSP